MRQSVRPAGHGMPDTHTGGSSPSTKPAKATKAGERSHVSITKPQNTDTFFLSFFFLFFSELQLFTTLFV